MQLTYCECKEIFKHSGFWEEFIVYAVPPNVAFLMLEKLEKCIWSPKNISMSYFIIILQYFKDLFIDKKAVLHTDELGRETKHHTTTLLQLKWQIRKKILKKKKLTKVH